MNNIYCQKVELLLKLIPIITDEGVFAIHGGTAINLFLKDLPRYSVDIDLTYIPLEDRKTSIDNINTHLTSISNKAKEGLLFCLLGSDRPIHESFAPTLIDQREAMENQFVGMTGTPFSYDEFEDTRAQLIKKVNALMTNTDKRFLVSFEKAEPNWSAFAYPYFEKYPSVQWKLLNLQKLKKSNLDKMLAEARKLEELFGL